LSPSSSETLIAIVPDAAPHREQISLAVTQASGTSVGLDRIAEVAVAIVDLTAGARDGVNLPRPSGFPVLAIVDPGDKSMVARALELGAVSFVSPASLALELPLRLREMLQFRRLQGELTQARQLAEEFKQTKDFLERLINSSVDAIIAADMRGKVILFSKGAESILGYSSEEALKKLNVRNLYPPGVARQLMAQLRDPRTYARGRLVCRQEIFTQAGELVPVNMTASIIYEGERETATVGIYTDLRDWMQLERKLSDAETRLEGTEKTAVIVELAGTAAHELNQPLTSVMGYADLLKRKLTPDDFAYRPVDIIYREAERMAEIVRKIGKITRYETKSYIGTAKILDLDKASSHED
jgi:PAS domain S-box-containing protein